MLQVFQMGKQWSFLEKSNNYLSLLYMLRWIILFLFFSLFGTYAFQAIKTLTQHRSILILYWIVVVMVLGNFAYHSAFYTRENGFSSGMSLALGLFISLFVFQTLVVLFLFFEDIIRIPQAIYRFFTQGENRSRDRR